MRALGKILAYVAWTVCAGALLAPLLWWAAQACIAHGWLADVLAGFGFQKYLNRSVLLAALVGLVPFLRWLGVRSTADLGLVPNPNRWRHLALGCAGGAAGLWLVGGVVLAMGRATLRASLPWHKLTDAALTAAAVAPLEELFFRGALYGVLRRELGARRALWVLSGVFAVLHFLHPKRQALAAEVSIWSGFALLPSALSPFTEPRLLVGGLTTLLLVGYVLGLTVERTKSLALAVGLHAGWVFALRSFGYFTRRAGEPSFWLGGDLLTGLLPVGFLLVTLALVWVLVAPRAKADQLAGVSS